MKGYIAITNQKWFDFQKNHNFEVVNFYRKNKSIFRVLVPGELVFFLVKNEPGNHVERAIKGYGIFQRFEVLTPELAWDKYQQANGLVDKGEFINVLDKVFKVSDSGEKIGCIILSDLKFFSESVFLSNTGIQFQNAIISGKTITDIEVQKILEKANQLNIKQVDQESIIDEAAFPEGRKIYIKHISSERNKALIDMAKRRFINNHGSLFCESCGFSFESSYGEIGKDFIEAHHILPVSEMKEGHLTKVDNLVMVCSNCHRMLHRKRPWITIETLTSLLVKKK